MKFRTIAAAVTTVALVGGGAAVAQNNSPDVVLTYTDTAVDRPIAIAVAELNELHGQGITHAVPLDTITASPDTYADACIVAVGREGQDTADYLRAEYSLNAMEAQGRDRDETAWLTSKRVVTDC